MIFSHNYGYAISFLVVNLPLSIYEKFNKHINNNLLTNEQVVSFYFDCFGNETLKTLLNTFLINVIYYNCYLI